MGELIRFKCINKDFEKNLQTGQGMVYMSPDRICDFFEDSQVAEMKDLIAEGFLFNARRMIAFNSGIRDYFTVIVCELVKGGDVRRFAGRLPEGCIPSDTDTLSDPEKKDFICPVCGSRLEVKRVGFWD